MKKFFPAAKNNHKQKSIIPDLPTLDTFLSTARDLKQNSNHWSKCIKKGDYKSLWVKGTQVLSKEVDEFKLNKGANQWRNKQKPKDRIKTLYLEILDIIDN